MGRRLLSCDAGNYREGALYWLNFLATMTRSASGPEVVALISRPASGP